jgi:2-methylisocitrate lyase-like PEP mutase family enzyme
LGYDKTAADLIGSGEDESTVIIARTCAFSPTQVDAVGMTVEEARERVGAYAESGVDAIMIPAQPNRARSDIETIREVTDLPQCVLRMTPDLIQDQRFLEANNVRLRYISQSTVFGQIVPFVYDIMKSLRDDRTGTAAMSEEDSQYGLAERTSQLGMGSAAALSLITTPRFRHEFVN